MEFQKSVNQMNLQEFRPGIRSKAEFGDKLVMACMGIDPEKEDTGHQHPFEQCGIVIEGKIELFIGDVRTISRLTLGQACSSCATVYFDERR